MSFTTTTGYNDIQHFSDVVVDQWQIKFDSLVAAGAGQYNDFLTEITTDGLGAHIPFINKWEKLDEVELNEPLTEVDTIPLSLNADFGRKGKILRISKTNWMNPSAQSRMMTQINTLVAEAAYSRARAIARVWNDGEVIPSYDAGKAVFATDHNLGHGPDFSNYLIDNPLTPEGYSRAKAALKNVPLGPDGDGLPGDLWEFTLVVPNSLEFTAKTLLNQGLLPAGSYANTVGNVLQSDAKLIISPLLDDPNDWILIATLAGIKPFACIKAENSNPSLIPLIEEWMEHVYNLNWYKWKLDLFEQIETVHYYQMVKNTAS